MQYRLSRLRSSFFSQRRFDNICRRLHASWLVQKLAHLADAFLLGADNCVQHRLELGADIVLQCGFGHLDGAHMVGDHFPDKVRVDLVGVRGA